MNTSDETILTKDPAVAPGLNRAAAVAGPIAEKERIVSIDVLRGFALLGILPMNIQYFSMIAAAYMNPTAYGDLHGANYLVWLLSHVLADEKFMAIFSMLFGAGILLMTSHIEAAGKRSGPLHYRRMAWLILFGAAHAYLLWSGDILFTYGICGLVVYLCRKMTPRTLLVAGLLTIAVASVVLVSFGTWSGHFSPAMLAQAREDLWMPSAAMVAKEVAAYRGSWIAQMRYRVPDAVQMETIFFLTFSFWRAGGLMLIGMALFKLGVFGAKLSPRSYWAMIAAAVFVGIPVTLYGTHKIIASGWNFRYSFFYGAEYNYWASLLVSAGWIGAMMLATHSLALLPLTRRLAAVGRMAFSNYILHSVICTFIFYGFGLALFGRVERVWQFAMVVAIWIVQLIVSPIWLRFFMFGPLEWLWRSLTYLRWEPFRRSFRAGQPASSS
jgi:uncharacterized protein